MEEKQNEQAQVQKSIVSKSRYFLGIQIKTASKGSNAGNKFGILNLYEYKEYDDGTTGYSVPEILMSYEKAKEIMALHLRPFTPVKVVFAETDSFYAKPKIESLEPLAE